MPCGTHCRLDNQFEGLYYEKSLVPYHRGLSEAISLQLGQKEQAAKGLLILLEQLSEYE
jgi:hypothetical protein